MDPDMGSGRERCLPILAGSVVGLQQWESRELSWNYTLRKDEVEVELNTGYRIWKQLVSH